MALRRRTFVRRQPVILHKINENITATQVRLVGDNVDQDIVTLEQAKALAEELELDLVEITAKADPPICRILDYKKFLFEHKKKQKKIRANTAKVIVKELRFGPNTDEHDFNFKLKHARKFLSDGAKLKAHVFFKGRTIVYKEKGEILLLRLAQELEDVGVVEQMPKLEGKRMIMMVVPKKKH